MFDLRGPAEQAAELLVNLRQDLELLWSKGHLTRKKVVERLEDYEILADAVNANKHVKVTQYYKYINNRSQIEETAVLTGFETQDKPIAYVHMRLYLPY